MQVNVSGCGKIFISGPDQSCPVTSGFPIESSEVGGDSKDSAGRDFSSKWGETTKFVFSTTLKRDATIRVDIFAGEIFRGTNFHE